MIVLSIAVAIVANGFASRQRKLVLPGYYPNALRVPPRVPERVAPPPITETAALTATQPAPIETATSTLTPTTATATPATTTAPNAATPLPATASSAPEKSPVRPPAQAAAAAADALSRFQPHPDKAFVEISGADAQLLHARGVLFLDARRTSVFEEGHIAGARSFSVWESDIDDKVNALFAERGDPADQNLPIVIYCSGGACEDSHMLAQKLWGIQFNNVYVYKDGYPDWQQRGGATRTGAQR